MSELQVVEQVEVLVPLDRHKAEVLDGRIRRLAKQAGEQLVQVGRLLDEAQTGRVHETLGFPSWTAYVADALGGQLQLSGEARQAMVQLMAGEGMSVRAIASATGASKSTVARDIDQVSHNGTPQGDSDVSHDGTPEDSATDEPATVTGLDGKTYTKPKPKPKGKGDKPAPRRRPNARKTVELMVVQVGGWADGLSDVDPADLAVDAQVQDDIKAILGGVTAIQKFLDGVKPVRQPQIRTVYRNKVAAINTLYQELIKMHLNERWFKATVTEKDADALRLVITGLQQEHDYLIRKIQHHESAETPAQPEAITGAVTQ